MPGAEVAPSSTLDRLQAGLGAYSKAPYDALKDNAMNIGLASAPLISGAFDNQTSSAPKIHPGYIRGYDRDPVTGTLYQVSATPADQYTGGINFGGVPQVKYGANGGLMGYDDGGVTTDNTTSTTNDKSVRFGGVPELDLTGRDMNDKRSDSEKVQDYLMGKGPNPFLLYHKTLNPIEKAAEATKTLQQEIKEDQKRYGGGNPADRAAAMGSSVSNYAPDVNSYSNGLVHALLNPVANNAPIVDTTGYGSVAEAEAGQRAKVLNAINNTDFSGMDKGSVSNAPSTPDTKEVQDRINNTDFSGMDRSSFSAQNKALAEQYGQYRTLQQAQNETALAHDIAAVNAANAEGPPAANPMGKDPAQSQGQGTGTGTGTGTGEGVGRTPGEAHDGQGGTGEGGDHGESGPGGDGGGRGGSWAQGGYLNNGQFDRSYAYGGGIAALNQGGMYNLGSYSDGGRLLRGPGDGVSDSIPAVIGQKQPARLADGEFVIPARIVSELGNGSTEAGARKLYAMMDKVQKSRSKTVGKDKVAANTRADKYLPA